LSNTHALPSVSASPPLDVPVVEVLSSPVDVELDDDVSGPELDDVSGPELDVVPGPDDVPGPDVDVVPGPLVVVPEVTGPVVGSGPVVGGSPVSPLVLLPVPGPPVPVPAVVLPALSVWLPNPEGPPSCEQPASSSGSRSGARRRVIWPHFCGLQVTLLIWPPAMSEYV
jgi:hypothetical protein